MIRRRRRVSFALAACVVAALATSVTSALAQATSAIDPAKITADEIATLARRMTDLAGDQDARDQAGRRLLAIRKPEARTAVSFALTDPANPGGRLAAARAIAEDSPADAAFVDPLFVLLDDKQPRPLIDAAATALGNFKMYPDVSTRLIAVTDAKRPEVVRLAAIRALSAQIEKPAAQRLVQLAGDASPAVSAEAIKGLQAFASLSIATPSEWADWWKAASAKSDDRFRLETLTGRTTRVEAAARRDDSTFQELSRGTLATLQATPREAQPDALLKLLNSPVDATRLIAARQASDLATTGDLPAAARPAMRKLIADPSADVRLVAAQAAQNVNDVDAFGAIQTQVVIEPDARVRAELAKAAGLVGNVQAVPLLRVLLDDPSPGIVQAAASALAQLGPQLVQQSPADAASLAEDLQRILQSRGALAAAPRLRESLVAALVPLRQKSLGPMFVQMLTDTTAREPASIRRLAALGLGAIGDSQASDILVETLRGDDSPDVRLAAVDAMGAIQDPINTEPLRRRLETAAEPDLRVRDRAWAVLTKLIDLPNTPREQLAAWADQPYFKADANRAKRLTLFAALARKAEAAGEKDTQSSYLQAMGDAQMDLAQFADATTSYRRALAISRAQHRGGLIVALVESTLKSLLRSGDYPAAVKFATDLFNETGDEYRSSVGFEFKSEADRLSHETTHQDDALRLIRTALAMNPELPQQYKDQLAQIQRDVETNQLKRNEFTLPDWVRVYADARRPQSLVDFAAFDVDVR